MVAKVPSARLHALAMRVGRTCDAEDVLGVLDRLVAERGAPEHLRMDNGPELIAWALRDWCRMRSTATTYIEPGSPWENPFIESFNGRARDELLNVQEFATLLEAQARELIASLDLQPGSRGSGRRPHR